MQIYSQTELRDLVDALNALHPPFDQWKYTNSRKGHEDEFGAIIQNGDVYFKREHGGYDQALKLSRDSMEKLVFCIFDGNLGLLAMCKRLVEEYQEAVAEDHRKHSPLPGLLDHLEKSSSSEAP